MVTINVVCTFTEELLGTAPGNPEVYKAYVESKRPADAPPDNEAEAISLDEELDLGTTVFPRDSGRPFLWDYQIKGFCKDACGMLARAEGSDSSKLKAYKKVVDGLLFVDPRRIVIELPEDGKITLCERPLRAQTAKGERIALARSEVVPAGSRIAFSVTLMTTKLVDPFHEWMEYGRRRGLGQWRNSGKGTFEAALEVVKK